MFENILGQDAVVETLRRDVSHSALPSSILFHGPLYSGKLTTALELARGLTCENREVKWDCECSSCKMNRLVSHPYVMLMGAKDFIDEIYACADVLKRVDKPSTRYLFIRAVRKLLKRFEPILWEGNESKLAGVHSVLETISEGLEIFLPGTPLPSGNKLESIFKKLLSACSKIDKSILSDNIPIHHIRKSAFWSHTTSPGSRKVIIFENADRMGDSSRNALLKLLEEPPPEAYFILTTTRKEAIIPTLRSRLRPYHFVDRPDKVVFDILKRIFREESGEYKSIREYFLAWDASPDFLRSESRKFITSIFDGDSTFLYEGGDSGGLLEVIAGSKVFVPFLEELEENCRTLLLDRIRNNNDVETTQIVDIDLRRLEKWNDLIKNKLVMYEQLNLRPDRLVESLFYEMRACS